MYITLYFFANISKFFGNLWLSNWTTNPNSSQNMWNFVVFTLLDFSNCIFILLGDFLQINSSLRASSSFHKSLINSIIRRPLSFFKLKGSIFNRFTNEMDKIDNQIPNNLRMLNVAFFNTFSILIIIFVNSPLYILAFLPFFAFYYYVQVKYTNFSRKCKRFEQISNTPLTSLFTQTTKGWFTIKAFKAENYFVSKMQHYLNENCKIYFCSMWSDR